ncbi:MULTISPECIES: amidase [unclassified Pseudomonas]|uniref:amidase n=1 Tax=unclassified Pseudomonas TaxID=196821 RepID=UPI000CD0FE64|nr:MULTISPECIES: amidase [unclassified Pseudomonas]POA35626.1 amidase [Pseudomonas sp. GW456-R21]POA71794.1 amidase [Pseudomonas sp. GW460-R15]
MSSSTSPLLANANDSDGSLNELDATSIGDTIRSGLATATSVAEHFLTRIEEHEPQVHAFAAFNPQRVRAQAGKLAQENHQGLLAGVPVGIKDIFDSADQPTQFHSSIYTGHQPSRDAHVVTLLRQAGAVVMGKTHTTEFAYMHTGPTRNPHHLAHTPGSSSAGSAAGMAAGFFALALGTQTAGSLLKPAAYCGLYAFKPSLGLVSLEGVKPLAHSFDTVGWYGRSVRDLECVARVLIPGFTAQTGEHRHLRLGLCRTPRWSQVEPQVADAFETAIEQLRCAGHQVHEVQLPAPFARVFDDHALINDCEGARSLSKEFHAHRTQLSDSVLQMFERAAATDWEQESAAKARLSLLAPQLARYCQPFDAMLSVSCGIVAPLGLESTGPSDFIKFWGAFGLPQVNIPLNRTEGLLPVGLQMIGGFRNDRHLLWTADQLAATLNSLRTAPAPKTRPA